MLRLNSSLMIVTDLDGSLLDHHDYNWDAASEWLARLKQQAIPVVFCSSKTAASPYRNAWVSQEPLLSLKTAPLSLSTASRLRLKNRAKIIWRCATL